MPAAAAAAARIMTPYLVQRDFLSKVEQSALLAWALGMRRGSRRQGLGAWG